MSVDPLDDILLYLGLGEAAPVAAKVPPRGGPPEDRERGRHSDAGEEQLAVAAGITLWRTGNESAEWIELRGPFATVRVTRPKARLLLRIRQSLRGWSTGARPTLDDGELSVRTVPRFGDPHLEVRYRTWKPLRLTREQARALLLFEKNVQAFAEG